MIFELNLRTKSSLFHILNLPLSRPNFCCELSQQDFRSKTKEFLDLLYYNLDRLGVNSLNSQVISRMTDPENGLASFLFRRYIEQNGFTPDKYWEGIFAAKIVQDRAYGVYVDSLKNFEGNGVGRHARFSLKGFYGPDALLYQKITLSRPEPKRSLDRLFGGFVHTCTEEKRFSLEDYC